jgi:hypothetical protein
LHDARICADRRDRRRGGGHIDEQAGKREATPARDNDETIKKDMLAGADGWSPIAEAQQEWPTQQLENHTTKSIVCDMPGESGATTTHVEDVKNEEYTRAEAMGRSPSAEALAQHTPQQQEKHNLTQPTPAQTDDELLDAAIAANMAAAELTDLDLIAPGQFAEEEFPELGEQCTHCGTMPAESRCARCKQRYCCIECQRAGWKQMHKVSCGSPLPTPQRIARAADLREVVSVLHEFGRANAALADLCLLRLAMSLSKEGRKLRLHMPDSGGVAAVSAALRHLASSEPSFLQAVFSAMDVHQADTWVQNSALALLTSISGIGGNHSDVGQSAACDALAQAGAFLHLCKAMAAHPQDARIQVGGCCVLSAACRGIGEAASKRREMALKAGALPVVLSALTVSDAPQLRGGAGGASASMRRSDAMLRVEATSFMRNEAATALMHCCASECWRAAATGAGATDIASMLAHSRDAEVQRHGCGLLEALCQGEGDAAEARRATACQGGAVAAVCALRDAIGPVKKAARNALVSICAADEGRRQVAALAGAPRSWLQRLDRSMDSVGDTQLRKGDTNIELRPGQDLVSDLVSEMLSGSDVC